MVDINLTLLVELGLFLLFLWGTAVFILRPTVRVLDDREEHIAQDDSDAQDHIESAEALESQYAQEIAQARRSADEELRREHRAAIQEHDATLARERRSADEAVAEVRQEALTQIEAQRPQYSALTPELVKVIHDRLIEEGDG